MDLWNANPAKVTILAGHYGSGKTHIAVNYALWQKARGISVALADLDVVNPYFRTTDAKALLQEAGVELIASEYALSNLEVPSTPSAVAAAITRDGAHCVIDVGGDDRGALALGRYAAQLAGEPSCDIWLVVNASRPLTATPEACLEIMREIETASRQRFTGIIHNTHLAVETTPETVLAARPYAAEISKQTKLPIAMTTVREDLLPLLQGQVENLFALKILRKPEWDIYFEEEKPWQT
jgi:hypothetical protein